MENLALIESFSEIKDVKNIDRETMMNILEDVFKSVLAKKYDDQGNFDVIINATSLGLNNETFNLDISNIGDGKLFYDVIYNQNITNFLKHGKKASLRAVARTSRLKHIQGKRRKNNCNGKMASKEASNGR